nr:MAG TPA: hypothetical protein [Caudoviricetes sp.]
MFPFTPLKKRFHVRESFFSQSCNLIDYRSKIND